MPKNKKEHVDGNNSHNGSENKEALNEEQNLTDEQVLSETDILNAQIAQLQDQNLRQLAEFDNFRKRVVRERTEIYNLVTAETTGKFLEVLDNLERALNSDANESDLKTGLTMILEQFKDTMEKLGVTEIESENQPFDPEVHEAAGQREDENYGENIICQVLQKGYKLGDRIIRNPMVIVANP